MHNLLRSNQIALALVCTLLGTSAFAADAEKTPVTVAQQQNAEAKEDTTPAPKIMFKPGQTLETTTDTEDIVATWDTDLAKKQVDKYADSPEASFILAVALTRTSRVEEALKEVQRARRLAGSKGGPEYFDKMISQYEKMLTAYPDDNQVRYGLAWAYYMKAYLQAQRSRQIAKWMAINNPKAAAAAGIDVTAFDTTKKDNNNKDVVKALQNKDAGSAINAIAGTAAAIASGKADALPHIPTALENVQPADISGIKSLYEKALAQIDELLQRDPHDIWTIIYGAHLRAEYSGNLEASMKIWRDVAAKNPNNPGPFFFLGEGYLKQGNLKESINNVGKAIALRALGN